MITQEQYDKIVNSNDVKTYETRMNTFKGYIEVLGLTFQSDYNMIELEFKTKLFADLMKVDKGLAMEYNTLLKTPEAKARKIESKIDLHGYEEPIRIKTMLKELEGFHKKVFNPFASYNLISMHELISKYDGVASAFIQQYIIDWSGLEQYKTLFDAYEQSFNDLLPVYRKMGYPCSMNSDFIRLVFNDVSGKFNPEGKFLCVEFNELRLHQVLKGLK